MEFITCVSPTTRKTQFLGVRPGLGHHFFMDPSSRITDHLVYSGLWGRDVSSVDTAIVESSFSRHHTIGKPL